MFREHWSAAVKRGGLSDDAGVDEVAPYFELMDGEKPTDPPYLARLQRRFGPDKTTE